ncbi:DUF302 domain-containing protein [Palleronia pelagia]|uniref:Uncharacterized conserved protein, DUF302 family n=1 Tax=Palleronia pelagia TaxID=387096 RepID=A0A1H8A4D7_9RHOB|nr:DUF302 domain-containing protein [Palleronia pelagia]SEM65560.1 Uncharacterized conserved protein, DUF302 family [Palleronia pelagia]
MRRLIPVLGALLAATPALADYQRMQAEGSVPDAMARLTAAVEEAGATVFATIDHGAGAASVDMELPDSQLLIFGNPMLGTPAMQADPLAGLHLPLKILVYSDGDGQTWVAYEEVDDTFDELDAVEDLEVLEQMEGALGKFSSAAAGE